MLKSKLHTLRSWYAAMSGPVSVYRGLKLFRTGRDADPTVGRTRTVRARGLPLALHSRPGTSDFPVFLELFVSGEYAPAARLVPPPVRWVLDLGGNVGFATAYLHRTWPD